MLICKKLSNDVLFEGFGIVVVDQIDNFYENYTPILVDLFNICLTINAVIKSLYCDCKPIGIVFNTIKLKDVADVLWME